MQFIACMFVCLIVHDKRCNLYILKVDYGNFLLNRFQKRLAERGQIICTKGSVMIMTFVGDEMAGLILLLLPQ